MESETVDVTSTVVLDLVCFVIIGGLNLVLVNLKPTWRGFYCDDETIRYPRHDSTVPSIVLNIVGVSVPLILVLFWFYFLFIGCLSFMFTYITFFELRNTRKGNANKGPIHTIRNHKIRPAYWNLFKIVVCYGSGAIFTEFLTDLGKVTVGRLRPNFMDVCKPKNLNNLCQAFNYEYIVSYECQASEDIVNKSRVSFPSGHTSFSFYVAVFLVLYLQKKWRVRVTLLKPVTQFLIIALAWFVGLSRVMDNKHHWSDVTAGMILGISVALINTIIIHRLFDDHKNEKVNGHVTEEVAISTHRESNDRIV